jgi:aldose 1-epimerase
LIHLLAGAAQVDVDEIHGGRIERLTVDDLDLLVPPERHEHNHGAFPMAPWAGRVRHGQFTFDGIEHQLPINHPPHAIHGTVRDQRWAIDDSAESSAAFSTELGEPWPFRGRVVQRIALSSNALELEMEVHATDGPMPTTCGWHPWWSREVARGGPVEIELHAASMYKRDEEGIPTGELVAVPSPPWDDCFTDLHSPVAVLTWPGAATVTIESDCPNVVVFTEPDHAVCVEPQSGPPDAVNLGPRVVEPGTPLVVRTRWEWALTG